jgi:Protein of unknown function (DUF2934)
MSMNETTSEATLRGALTTSSGNSAIEALAHELWEERGCPIGSPEEDWFRAERQLSERQVTALSA